MRVLVVITKADIGGAQTVVRSIVDALIARGDEVHVCSRAGGHLWDDLKRMGAMMHENEYFSNSWSPIVQCRSIFFVRKLIRNTLPDIVSVHSSAGGFVTRVANIGLGVPVVFHAHGWGFTGGAPQPRRTIAWFVESLLSPLTDTVVCVSANDARLARGLLFPPRRIEVVHNGVSIVPSVQLTLRDFSQPLSVVFVGRMCPPKVPLVLCKALRMLPQEVVSRITVTFIGGGYLIDEVEKKYGSNVRGASVKYLGDVSHGRVLEELSRAHVLVLVSQWEGFPMVILEGLSYGLPVIASNVGGVSEAVDGEVGVLLSSDLAIAALQLSQALSRYQSEKDYYLHQSRAARERVVSRFGEDGMCQKVLAVYDAVICRNNLV